MLSKKANILKPSPTLALAAKAKELQSQGIDVVSLTVGEPDWPTVKSAQEAGIKAIQDGKTKYTPAGGTPQIRQAIAKLTNEHLNLDYGASHVTVTSGAKFIIYAALECLADPGDEVVIPVPYWVSYSMMVEMVGATPVFARAANPKDFYVKAKDIEKVITSKTKVFMFNSPNNPTGLEYSEQDLREIAEVLKKHPQIIVLSDDIYNQLSFSGKKFSPHLLQVAPELKDRVVCINGASKAYSMTGWRLGWAVAAPAIVKAMENYQSQTLGAPSSISQEAALAALNKRDEVPKDLAELVKRKQIAMSLFSKIPNIHVFEPPAAFYLWIDISKLVGKKYKSKVISDSSVLSNLLLEEKNLVVVPGIEFGLDGYLRASFAVTEEQLKKAAERFTQFISELS